MGKIAEKLEEISDSDWESVNPENRKIVEEFLEESVQLSPYTIRQYTSALKIYFWFVKESLGDKPFYEIRSRDYLKYQNFLVRRGLSSAAIKLKRSAVSSLNGWIELYYSDVYENFRNYINKSIATPPPSPVHEKEPLTLEEYEHLCKELEKQSLWQQLAYIKFSFSTGARRNEVRQLLREAVYYEPKIVTIQGKEVKTYFTQDTRCKGRGVKGKVRKLQYDSDARDAIVKWLEIRGDDDCPYVFVTKQDGKYHQVSESTFNLWSDKYFEPIVGRRFHPHLLRSSRATTLSTEQGRDIHIIQKLLGHNDPSTTAGYIVRKDENDADEAFA